MNIQINCEEISPIVFHFNKMHLQDSNIPMWTLKHKGQTYYIHHMESLIGFSTKETPDNQHTKGSLKFKGKLKIFETNNETHALVY